MTKRATRLAVFGILLSASCSLFIGCAEDNDANMMKGAPPAGGTPAVATDAPTPPPVVGAGGQETEEFKAFRAKQNEQMYKNYPGPVPK